MTAPDPGLTDLIAADLKSHDWGNKYENAAHEDHILDGGCKICRCDVDAIAARALSVVEQHTNGRTAANLGGDPQDYEIAWAAKLRWQERAEKDEATIARVRAVLPHYSAEPGGKATAEQIAWLDGTKHVQRQLRAALEGEQQ